MNRRQFLATLSASLEAARSRLPANENVKWALSLALWNHFPRPPITEILDVMKDTGFPGIRLTSFPAFLETYGITKAQLLKEMEKRGLQAFTISFNAPMHDPARRKQCLDSAREAMRFLKDFEANHLVVFSPGRIPAGQDVEKPFAEMCRRMNEIGEIAGEMGFRAGLHNHLDQMVETPEEVHKCMAMTDPKLFHFAPDTAHLHLGGSDVVEMFETYKHRLMCMDYKDAKWTTPTTDWVEPNGRIYPKDSRQAKFLNSIYDLGDGEIDFPACHRVLKSINFRGWICIDLDTAREGPRRSYERCAAYITSKLEPIYQ